MSLISFDSLGNSIAGTLPNLSQVGNVIAGESLIFGLGQAAQALMIIPQGMLGAISIQATLEETMTHTLSVTEHPVQSGAAITDHSYREPVEITMRCVWSNSSQEAAQGAVSALFEGGSLATADFVGGIYTLLLRLQQDRVAFTVRSTIRNYDNMLITSLSVDRDQTTSQALMVTVTCREIIVVSTQVTNAPSAAQLLNPQDNQAVVNVGPQTLVPGNPSPGGSLPINGAP